MGKILVANNSSIAAHAGYVGVVAPTMNNAKKRVYLHQVRVSPRGAAIAADVQLYLFDSYTGLGAELLTAPNFVPTFSSTAAYESDFTADTDSWLDSGAGDMVASFNQTVGGKTGCLKMTADVGGDPFQMSRAATRVAATHYKITFDVFCETGSTLGNADFIGVGKTTASTTNALTRNTGNNIIFGADNAWKSVTLYSDAGADTALDLCAFTAKDGSTGSLLAANKFVAFKDIKIYAQETASAAAWTGTMADDDDFLWDYRNAELDKVVDNTNAVTSNNLGGVVAGDLYATSYVHVRSATGVTVTFGGTTLDAAPAAGTLVQATPITTTAASSNLVFTPDATLVGTIDTASVKKLGGVNTNSPYLKDSILTAVTTPHVIEFSTKQPWSTSGWLLYATSAGSSSLMDMSLVYEVV